MGSIANMHLPEPPEIASKGSSLAKQPLRRTILLVVGGKPKY
jgi:hypothetical protein